MLRNICIIKIYFVSLYNLITERNNMNKKKTNGKDPAVLFYTQDFIVGTFSWTHEQKGKYITLLCLQHQKLNKLTLTDLQIAEGDETILEKFPLHSDGYYYNDRMSMEIENRKVRTDASRNNGKLGGRPSKKTQEKPMGFNLDNLKETYLKPNIEPNNNLTGTGNENEIVNEDISENVTESEVKILTKLEDKLLDVTTFLSAYKEIEEYGGVEKYYKTLGYDESQRENWNKHINNKLEILT